MKRPEAAAVETIMLVYIIAFVCQTKMASSAACHGGPQASAAKCWFCWSRSVTQSLGLQPTTHWYVRPVPGDRHINLGPSSNGTMMKESLINVKQLLGLKGRHLSQGTVICTSCPCYWGGEWVPGQAELYREYVGRWVRWTQEFQDKQDCLKKTLLKAFAEEGQHLKRFRSVTKGIHQILNIPSCISWWCNSLSFGQSHEQVWFSSGRAEETHSV